MYTMFGTGEKAAFSLNGKVGDGDDDCGFQCAAEVSVHGGIEGPEAGAALEVGYEYGGDGGGVMGESGTEDFQGASMVSRGVGVVFGVCARAGMPGDWNRGIGTGAGMVPEAVEGFDCGKIAGRERVTRKTNDLQHGEKFSDGGTGYGGGDGDVAEVVSDGWIPGDEGAEAEPDGAEAPGGGGGLAVHH